MTEPLGIHGHQVNLYDIEPTAELYRRPGFTESYRAAREDAPTNVAVTGAGPAITLSSAASAGGP